jgi:hypothetical protein
MECKADDCTKSKYQGQKRKGKSISSQRVVNEKTYDASHKKFGGTGPNQTSRLQGLEKKKQTTEIIRPPSGWIQVHPNKLLIISRLNSSLII